MKDYYSTLEVERDANADDIKRAYRRLAMKYHPDRNPGDRASEERFKEINEAYSCLSDSDKRSNYDRFGSAEPGAGFGGGFGGFDANFGDVFEGIFGSFFGGAFTSRARRAQRGVDLRYDLEISLEDAAFGIDKELDIPRWQQCDDCQGTGSKSAKPTTCTVCNGKGHVSFQQGFFSVSKTCSKCQGEGKIITDPCPSCDGSGLRRETKKVSVKVPAGVDTGSRLKLSGEGEPGLKGGPPGDLYIVLGVKPHEFFRRDGMNLFCEVPITFPQAALGDEIDVPTLDGERKLKIPAGTQPGSAFRLKGRGMPGLGVRGRGDQVVIVNVIVPNKINRKQRELIREFERLSGEESISGVKEKMRGIFGSSQATVE